MRKEDYDLMHELEAEFWWFVGMRRITHALLSRHLTQAPRAVADVGCGTGINLLWMAQHFRPERLVGFDYSETALGWCRQTLRQAPSYSKSVVPRLTRGDVRSLPFESDTFDLVTILDVLDLFPAGGDERAMGEVFRVLKRGGVAFIREPAYRWLLSSHDTLFETRHRYTAGELRRKMRAAGFGIERTTYANTLLFPAAAARRLLRRFGLERDHTDTQPWPPGLQWLNGPFAACLGLEAWWLARGGRLPFGLSAIVIGRKP